MHVFIDKVIFKSYRKMQKKKKFSKLFGGEKMWKIENVFKNFFFVRWKRRHWNFSRSWADRNLLMSEKREL